MEFKYPTLFALLALVTLGLSVYYLLWRKQKQRLYFISSLAFLKKFKPTATPRAKLLLTASLILYGLLAALLIVLSARPQISLEKSDDKHGLDIIVAVDGSGSMRAGGFGGHKHRLAAVQSVATSFVEKLENDRIGLIAFSSNMFTLCPLTHDYDVFKYYLDFMDFDKSSWFIQGGSTAVGDAIIYTTDKFQANVDRTKIVILLTDGASNKGINPVEAAQYAKKNKVKVYTLLVAGNDMVDPRAVTVYQQISDTTNGFFYLIKDTQQLDEVFTKIQSEEKKKLKITSPKIYLDNPVPFIIGIGILWVGYVISYSVRRTM